VFDVNSTILMILYQSMYQSMRLFGTQITRVDTSIDRLTGAPVPIHWWRSCAIVKIGGIHCGRIWGEEYLHSKNKI